MCPERLGELKDHKRITAAWCKTHDVPIEKIFTRTLLTKCRWDVSTGTQADVFERSSLGHGSGLGMEILAGQFRVSTVVFFTWHRMDICNPP